jgi:Ca2+-binding EF-hand superfamily protein
MTSPSKLKHAYTVSEEEGDEESVLISTPSRATNETSTFRRAQTEPPPSPTPARRSQSSSPSKYNQLGPTPVTTTREPRRHISSSLLSTNDNLGKLPPALLHNLRESFSVLDANSTGSIDATSVAETLQSLGLNETNLSQFFPAGQPQSMALPQYLSQLANILVNLSPQQELLNAFSAFDDDDSGQIDILELKTALLNTAPEPGERALSAADIDRAMNMEGFTGRRILGKNVIGMAGVRGLKEPSVRKGGGDVFRYQEFVGNLTGGPATDGQGVAVR